MSKRATIIRIGPYDFEYRRVSGLTAPGDGTKVDGYVNFQDGEICCESALCNTDQEQTLWHEIMHAWFRMDCRKEDEKLIDKIAYWIVQTLRDNPCLKAKRKSKKINRQ